MKRKMCAAFHNSISMHITFLFRTCRVKSSLGHLFSSVFGVYDFLPRLTGFLLYSEVFSLLFFSIPYLTKRWSLALIFALYVFIQHVYENLLHTHTHLVPVNRLCNKLLLTYILFLVLCPCEQGFIFREISEGIFKIELYPNILWNIN